MEKKKITLSVGPSVIILVLLVAGGIYLLKRMEHRKQALTIENTAVITTGIRTLGELTTACFYDEIVLNSSKPGILSSTPLGSIAKEGLGRDLDDHLVIIARGTVRAGIDLQKMSPEDVRIAGDTVVIRLPYPEYLDIIVNPSHFEIFAESGIWTQQQVASLQDTARERLIREADIAGLKSTAYEGAMDAVTNLLAACGYSLIRFDHPPFYFPMPAGFEE